MAYESNLKMRNKKNGNRHSKEENSNNDSDSNSDTDDVLALFTSQARSDCQKPIEVATS